MRGNRFLKELLPFGLYRDDLLEDFDFVRNLKNELDKVTDDPEIHHLIDAL